MVSLIEAVLVGILRLMGISSLIRVGGKSGQMISTVCKTHHHRMTPRSQTRCGFFLPLPRLVCAWQRPREKQDQKARDPERQKVINPTSGNTPEITLTSVGLGPEMASPLFLPYPIKVVKYKESLPRHVQEGPWDWQCIHQSLYKSVRFQHKSPLVPLRSNFSCPDRYII